MKKIAASFTLPNGSVLKNRIAKSAMSENIGTLSNAPTKTLINAYKVWAKGNPCSPTRATRGAAQSMLAKVYESLIVLACIVLP